MQIKTNKIIIRHSSVASTISNDSNTQYSYNVFNLIAWKKLLSENVWLLKKNKFLNQLLKISWGICLLFQENVLTKGHYFWLHQNKQR